MASTTNVSSGQKLPGVKQQFLDTLEREHATTLRALRAYPEDKLDLKPHAKSGTARDVAWIMPRGMMLIEKALTTGFDWSVPPKSQPAPESMDAIVDTLEQAHRRVVGIVRDLPEEQLSETVKFFVAPKTMGDVPKLQFIWMILHDQIHHRGQFSVYLRLADAKVPSIYGPSADEPWT